jgi:hypothetical protein
LLLRKPSSFFSWLTFSIKDELYIWQEAQRAAQEKAHLAREEKERIEREERERIEREEREEREREEKERERERKEKEGTLRGRGRGRGRGKSCPFFRYVDTEADMSYRLSGQGPCAFGLRNRSSSTVFSHQYQKTLICSIVFTTFRYRNYFTRAR